MVFCGEDILKKSNRATWPEDYFGLVIANNMGFQLGGRKFWEAVRDGKLRVEEAKGNRANILKVGLRRCDCYMNDRLSILWELKKMKEEGVYDEGGKHARLIEGATITIEQGFLGITERDKGKFFFKDDFLRQFDFRIYEMRRNGEIQKIVDKFVQ